MNIAILEKNGYYRDRVSRLLNKELRAHNHRAVILVLDKANFEQHLMKGFAQLYILDVGSEGIELAGRLRERGFRGELILMSWDDEDILRCLDVNPLYFIVKDRLALGIKVSIELMHRKGKLQSRFEFTHGTSKNRRMVDLESVVYIGSMGHRIAIYTEHENFLQSGSMSDMEKRLNARGFVRIHRSFIVNCRYISEICGYEVILLNGECLPIAKNRFNYVRELFLRYTSY